MGGEEILVMYCTKVDLVANSTRPSGARREQFLENCLEAHLCWSYWRVILAGVIKKGCHSCRPMTVNLRHLHIQTNQQMTEEQLANGINCLEQIQDALRSKSSQICFIHVTDQGMHCLMAEAYLSKKMHWVLTNDATNTCWHVVRIGNNHQKCRHDLDAVSLSFKHCVRTSVSQVEKI